MRAASIPVPPDIPLHARIPGIILIAILALASTSLAAPGDLPEFPQDLCQASRELHCSGQTLDCRCEGDAIGVLLARGDSPSAPSTTLDLEEFTPGELVTAWIVLDVTSPDINGWSYALAFDPAVLEVVEVTHEGTALESWCTGQVTGVDAEAAVIVGSFTSQPVGCPTFETLEAGPSPVARVTFSLLTDPGAAGTKLPFLIDHRTPGNFPILPAVHEASGGMRLIAEAMSGTLRIRPGAPPGVYRRGDLDQSGQIDLTDAILSLGYLFSGQDLACEAALDLDADTHLNVTDVIRLLGHLFHGTRVPEPFRFCGKASEEGGLGCAGETACR